MAVAPHPVLKLRRQRPRQRRLDPEPLRHQRLRPCAPEHERAAQKRAARAGAGAVGGRRQRGGAGPLLRLQVAAPRTEARLSVRGERGPSSTTMGQVGPTAGPGDATTRCHAGVLVRRTFAYHSLTAPKPTTATAVNFSAASEPVSRLQPSRVTQPNAHSSKTPRTPGSPGSLGSPVSPLITHPHQPQRVLVPQDRPKHAPEPRPRARPRAVWRRAQPPHSHGRALVYESAAVTQLLQHLRTRLMQAAVLECCRWAGRLPPIHLATYPQSHASSVVGGVAHTRDKTTGTRIF
jgi:hypothetical protein